MWQNISNALRARRKFRIAFHLQKEEYKLHPYVHCKEIQVKWQPNRPFRSSKISRFQNEVLSKTFLVKLKFYLHEKRKKIDFHINSFALSLALKLRLRAAWKLCSRKFDKSSWQDFPLNRPEAINCKFRRMSIYHLFLIYSKEISLHERFVWAKYSTKSAFCPFTIKVFRNLRISAFPLKQNNIYLVEHLRRWIFQEACQQIKPSPMRHT